MVTGAGDKILKRWALPLHSFQSALSSTTKKSSTANAELKCWTITPSHNIRGHDNDINSIAISPNDSLIASGSHDKTIRLWNSEDLTTVATLKGHKRQVWKVLFSPIDKVLLSTSADRTMKLWSIVDYSCLKTFEGNSYEDCCSISNEDCSSVY